MINPKIIALTPNFGTTHAPRSGKKPEELSPQSSTTEAPRTEEATSVVSAGETGISWHIYFIGDGINLPSSENPDLPSGPTKVTCFEGTSPGPNIRTRGNITTQENVAVPINGIVPDGKTAPSPKPTRKLVFNFPYSNAYEVPDDVTITQLINPFQTRETTRKGASRYTSSGLAEALKQDPSLTSLDLEFKGQELTLVDISKVIKSAFIKKAQEDLLKGIFEIAKIKAKEGTLEITLNGDKAIEWGLMGIAKQAGWREIGRESITAPPTATDSFGNTINQRGSIKFIFSEEPSAQNLGITDAPCMAET